MEGDSRRATGRPIGFATVAMVVLAGSIAGTEVSAGWQRPYANAEASNRVLEPAALSGDPDRHPGFSEILELERPQLPATTLRDVTGDGVPEVLLPYRGRVAALDMIKGAFVWQSGVAGIDSVVDFADFDGDGSLELLAASRRIGGGLISVNPQNGAILARSEPLPNRSGVDGGELAIADLDEDGDDDVVYPAAFFGQAELWIDDLGADPEGAAASLAFAGYANITPVRVGRFGSGSAPAVILDQGATQQLFERCDGSATGAACGESTCWCPTASFFGVHPSAYAFGEAFVVDVQGDGVDEILTVADDARYTRSVSLFSPAQARAAGSGAAGQLWYRDYSIGATLPVTPSASPIDLDGDSGPELLVNFVDNLADDRDLAGQPISDGIDHLGVSVAVFDARTGEVQATLEDAFAHGWLDLDDDGRPELVVSPVTGYKWLTGLRGYEFGCGGGCLEQAWSTPHGFAPTLARQSFDRHHVPTPTVSALRIDDRDALLAYHDGYLHLLRVVDGQLESVASRLLGPEQAVVSAKDGFALLSDGRKLQLVDTKLTSVGPTTPIPGQGTAPWMTARLDGFDAAIYEAKLYAAPLGESFVEPTKLLPHVALSENLDGVGSDEIIEFRRPQDELGPGFEIRALGVEDGQLAPRWTIVSEEEPTLAGLECSGAMHFSTGNFDGGGSRDLLFMALDAERNNYLVAVDGDSGAILRVQPTTTPATSFGPLVVSDVASVDGSLQPDGIDDVLVNGPNYLELIVFGRQAPIWTQPTGFYHSVAAQADLDGDGHLELISTTSNTLENPGDAMHVGATLQAIWGPTQLGLPTGRTQVLSFAHVDGQAGLDMLYITGEGALELRNGQTGAMLPGAPIYLLDGERSPVAQPDAASLGALMVIDVDNDGHDEAIVGADDGWVYALDIADEGTGNGSIEWALEVGAPVSQLAAGDVDGDGSQELLVGTESGQGFVLDSLGVKLDITDAGEECFELGAIDVSGTAQGIAFVDVYLNGELVQTVAVEGSTWSVVVSLPGPGEYEVRAEGRDENGELVAIATSALCGGEDEGDEDEEEDEGGSFPGFEEWNPRGRCNCSSEPERNGAGGLVPLGVVLGLAWRRRVRRRA